MTGLVKFLMWMTACAAAMYAAEVTGTVLDASSTAVPGIVVSLGGRQQVTGDTGAFRFRNVVPGSHRLTIEHAPFRPVSRAIQVPRDGSPAPVTITLELAEVQNQLTVTAEAPAIDTNPAENLSSVTIEAEDLQGLPVLGSDYTSVLEELVGGAGADPGGATVIVDGVEMDAGSVPVEAIQQVRVNRDPYTAEFSRPGRGRIEITTRDATADFHGSLRTGFRDSILDARNAFAAERPDERRTLFAGYLTGPLDRSGRTSFMLAAERENDDLQSLVYARTPGGLVNQQVQTPGRETDVMIRIRRLMGSRHVLNFRFDRENRSAENRGVGGFRLPEVAFHESRQEKEWRMQHTAFLSANLISDLWFEWETSENRARSVAGDSTQFVVADAFVSGGAQVNRTRSEKEAGLKYVVSWSKGPHLLRGGMDVPDWNWQTFVDLSNRQGTWQFASLQDYQANQPFAFTRQIGDGRVNFRQRTIGLFVQDTLNVRPGLTLGLGLRYDRQNFIADRNNFAPRVSVAWSPGKQRTTVLRGGFGVFYDRLPSGVLEDTLLFGRGDFARIIITNPSWPDPFAGGEVRTGPAAIVRAAEDLRSPYILHYTFAAERKLTSRLTASATFTHYRGVSRFRSRDVNAPIAPGFLRPDPDFGIIRQIESSGAIRSNSLELGLSGRLTRFFTGSVRYELGRVLSNADSIDALPADSYRIGSEWSRSSRDRRHVVRAIGNVQVLKLFQTGLVFSAGSGAPYNLTTGRDENQDGIANDRPVGVSRNALQGPGWLRLDVRLTRDLPLGPQNGKGPRFAITADAFNVLNRVNYSTYVGNLSSPFFGLPVAAQSPRRVQLGLRFSF